MTVDFSALTARLCALSRSRLSELLASPQPDRERLKAGYQLLRAARNLELYRALLEKQLRAAPVDAAACAEAVFAAAREVAPLPPDHFLSGSSCPPLPVTVSHPALEQILLNLICNSLLYAGPCPVLRLRLAKQGGHALILLRDSGTGPAEPDPEALGLGLMLTRLFARQSNGRFFLQHCPTGTLAALALPICPAAALPPAPTAEELLADRFSPVFVQLSPRCILPEKE